MQGDGTSQPTPSTSEPAVPQPGTPVPPPVPVNQLKNFLSIANICDLFFKQVEQKFVSSDIFFA